MEAQTTYGIEIRSNENFFRKLLIIQVELERLGTNQPIYFDQAKQVIRTIDELLEQVMEIESGQDDS